MTSQRTSSPAARGRVGVLLVGVLILATACATAPAAPTAASTGPPPFRFTTDTFAFRNDIRQRDPDKPDLYANYCFVLARGVRQFFQHARFDPGAPRLSAAEYASRVRAVTARAAWEPPLPPDERVVIPGYANLREFSREQETAVKEGLGGRFLTWVHWTNWRVVFPMSKGQQAGVAEEITREIEQGRLVQLLVTNWPIPELNHTVVAYVATDRADRIEFTVWDPNEPDAPGTVTFDRLAQRFWATNIYATRPGPIRVFRMYHSPLL